MTARVSYDMTRTPARSPASAMARARAALAPKEARAHEVLHQVERGRAVAVRAYLAAHRDDYVVVDRGLIGPA